MWPSQRHASIGLDSRHRKSRARIRDRRGIRPIVTLLEERTLLSQPGTWAAVAPLPTARVYLGAATGNDGTIYAIGGLVYGDGHTSEVDAYNPATNIWTKIAPLPWAGETSAVSDHDLIYAISGNMPVDGNAGSVAAYNPQTNIWSAVASLPNPRHNFAATVGSDGTIYVMGGSGTNGVTNEVDAYNPTTNSWTTVAPLPEPAAYITAAPGTNGVVYIIGDDTGNGTVTGSSYAYHPSTNTWDQIASVPLYSSPWGLEGTDAATTGPNGTIYAFSAGWASSEVSAYNQNTNTWTQIASHLYYAYGKAATTGLDGTIYVMGGYSTNYAAVSEVDAYTPIPTTVDLTVTTLADDPATSILGQVTLRDAITMADADSTANRYVINFASGLQGTIDLTSALPALNNNIAIQGPGASNLTVQRDSTAPDFSVFTVNSGWTDTISELTITGGDAQSDTGGTGGAIDNGGTLIVNNDIFTANAADNSNSGGDWAWYSGEGGAIYNSGILTATNDTFSNNTDKKGYFGGGGGAIYNSGTLTATNDIFTNNTDNSGDGGAICNVGTLTTINDTFTGNNTTYGGRGGAISNSGTLATTSDIFSNNIAYGSDWGGSWGGAINNSGTLVAANDIFTNNTVYGGAYGGFYGGAYGGAIYNSGTLTTTNNTFTNNTSNSDNYGGGGAIYNHDMLITTNNTFTQNTAGDGYGGAIYNDSTATVTNNTIVDNNAANGGGIYNESSLTLNNTIVAGNTTNDVYGQVNGNNNLISINPLLAPLGNYGGPTQTMAILPGSPATDAGNNALIPAGITTDQRGEPRIVNGIVDIGAFESSGFTVTVTSGSGQSTGSLTAFSAPLVATVTANNPSEPVAGGLVTFTVPPSGASATLSGSPATISAPGTASVTAAANSIVGSYTVSATASGITTPASFSLANMWVPTFSALISPAIVYGTSTTTLTGHLGSGTAYPTGSNVSITLNSVTQTASVDGSGDFTTTFSTGSLGVAGGPYTVTYAFAGNSSFTAATDTSTTLTIGQATATVSVTPYSVTYDGNAHTATGTATGVGGVNLPASDLNLTGTTHTNAGTYSDTWTFADPNYVSQSGSVTDNIGQANANPGVTGYTVTYDGNAHTATGSATVASVDAAAGISLNSDFDLSQTVHTNAGSSTDAWSFNEPTLLNGSVNPNYNANYAGTTGTVVDTIAQATAAVSVTPYSVTYDGNAHTATGTATGVGGVNLPASDLNLTGTTHTNAGTYSDTWTFADPNYVSQSGSVTDNIGQANANPGVTGYTVTYDGNAHTATGSATVASVDAAAGISLNSDFDLSQTVHTNAGSSTDAWSFNEPTLLNGSVNPNYNANYAGTTGTVVDTIAQATAAVSVTPYSVTYDGNAHTATGTATGVGGVNLPASDLNLTGTTHTNAGTYSDTWTFADPNYVSQSGSVTDNIGQANANPGVTGYTVTYDGNAHTATGSATVASVDAAAGISLNSDFDLSQTVHTNAGSSTDAWSFNEPTLLNGSVNPNYNANYAGTTGTVVDTIAQATAAVSVTPYSVTYDGNAHTATGTATGVGGVNLPASDLNLTGTTHTNAGTYSDTWTFADPNYVSQSGSVTDNIGQANANPGVTGYTVTYDGNAHTATGSATVASVDAAAGISLNSDFDLSQTVHTNAGSSTDAWSFNEPTLLNGSVNPNYNANYAGTTGTVVDTIAQATAAVSVTPYSVTYDGNAHTATGTATGVGGVNLPASDLNLTGTTHTNAGTYSDTWTFADPNYVSQSGTVTDTIVQANAPATLNQVLVEEDYHALLNRSAELGGLTYWSTQLNNGVTPNSVGMGIANSTESKTDIVTNDYQSFLNRASRAGWPCLLAWPAPERPYARPGCGRYPRPGGVFRGQRQYEPGLR